jgi:2-polyprenyl-6-methoxyphenol hydroxylase-like FAD-dependent oxidoreductase
LLENTELLFGKDRGQGLNNAIHDVALLARKTKEHGFTPAAIEAYQAEMIPRARDAVIMSNENSLAISDWDKLTQSPLFKKGVKPK